MAHIAVYRKYRINDMGQLVGNYGQVWPDRKMIAECWGRDAPHALTEATQQERQKLCEKHLQEESVPLAGRTSEPFRVPKCRCGIYGSWEAEELPTFRTGIDVVIARCVLFGIVDIWTEMAKASGAIIEEIWCYRAVASWLRGAYPGIAIHATTNIEVLRLPTLRPILDGAVELKLRPAWKSKQKLEKPRHRHLRLDGRPWLTLKHIFADGKPHKTAEIIQYWEEHTDDYKKVGLCADCYQTMVKRRTVRPYGAAGLTCDHKRGKGSGMRDLVACMTYGPLLPPNTLIGPICNATPKQLGNLDWRSMKGRGWYIITPFGRRILRNNGHYLAKRRW